MNIHYIRNIQFTKLVKIQGRLREFNFRKLNGINEGQFTVDVSDDKGNRIMFSMQKNGTTFTFYNSPTLPSWILEQETVLSELIESELKVIPE